MPLTNQHPGAAPALETERLILRGFEAADLPAFCTLWNDPVVCKYITGKALPQEEQWSRLLNLVGHWQFVGFGDWATCINISAFGAV